MEEALKIANEILDANCQSWKSVSIHKDLTEDFIREFADKVDWGWISMYQYLSEDFIKESQHLVNWSAISSFQHLSEDFIREFAYKVNWDCISANQHLSEDFIREFKDKVNWTYISECQRLSEEFIREFKGKVNWDFISKYQRLSEGFIRKFKNWVNWYSISRYQPLSKEFIAEFKDKLDMGLIGNSWHYISTEEKKRAVMDTELYECQDDYFIAYKGIRADRYSAYNFQYQYLKGETYETWCDCSANENGFGFSAWTEEKAREYCEELLVRVKVRYKDVGRVVHDGGKIRCFKLEVLD